MYAVIVQKGRYLCTPVDVLVDVGAEHAIVHCLTDLEDYHMFLMGKNGKKLCIKNYWYRKCDLMDSSLCGLQFAHLHLQSSSDVCLSPLIIHSSWDQSQ